MTENPLLKALPPETDYLSYLTILEYNLTREQLPTLHEILQDRTLTANIGWDLVHLLLPLLPDSRLCLQDVARLGNPREVVLKVTELLEQLASSDEEDEEGHDEEERGQVDEATTENSESNGVVKQAESTNPSQDLDKGEPSPEQKQESAQPPSKALKFINLVSMLSILHPRIKTTYPSRFLSTSLQAVLPAYTCVAQDQDATDAVIALVKALSGTSRPKLPPRISSTSIPTQRPKDAEPSAPDPEGNDGSIGPDEVGLQKRLLQSFLTHVVESYVESLPAVNEVPGMAWSSRLQEKLHPEKNIPGRRQYSDMFAASDLHTRDTTMGQFLAQSRDLRLQPEDILASITMPDSSEPSSPTGELPSSASDVPLSRHGSLYLLTALAAASSFFDAPTSLPSLSIFPHFSSLLPLFIGVSSPSTAGTEPPCIIDAILFLGAYISNNSSIGTPENDEVFNETLQRLALLSANTPLPALRYHAHLLTAGILHSHPREEVRLAYIKDTLEHCPFENLKASAVGWLKTELLTASSPTSDPQNEGTALSSLFASDVALSELSPNLFFPPNLREITSSSEEEYLTSFSNNLPFWMAVLNLIYLIYSSPSLKSLKSEGVVRDAARFTTNLEELAVSVKGMMELSTDAGGVEGDLVLLEGMLEMVREKLG